VVKVKFRIDELREILARTNQSQREFARVLRIEPSHLSALIRGEHSPSPRLRRRIIDALDVPFDSLFEVLQADEN
jgi:transcriptional regulator with XRE-family HTH domain